MANEFDEVLDQEAAGTQPPLSSGLEKGEFDDVLDTEVSQQQNYVRNVIDLASKDNPEAAADRIRLSQTTGLPPDVVARNQQELKRREIARAIDLQRMMRDSPVLFRQMTDPTFTAAAIDDLGPLGKLESAVADVAQGARALASGLPRLSQGMYGTLAGGAGVLRAALDPFSGEDAPIPILPANPAAPLEQALLGIYRGQADLANTVAGDQSNAGFVGRAVLSGLESLGQNLPMMAAAVVAGQPELALYGMSASSAGQAYGTAREKGIDPAKAASYALLQGYIEKTTEEIPVAQLFKDLGAGAGFWKTLANQLPGELVGEQVATLFQDLNDWAVLNPEKPFSSYVEERGPAAVQTLIATLVGTGGNVAVAQGVDYAMRGAERKVQRAMADAERLQTAMAAAAQSKLRERAPETFQQLAEQMDGGSVYIDGQVLAQSGVDIAQVFPSLAEQVKDAEFLKSTVEIPLAEALTAVPGTALEEVFLQNAKSAPDALSRAEVEQAGEQGQQFIQQEAERVLQQAKEREAWQSEVDTVQQTIKDQLDQAGRFTSDVNEGYARLQSQFFSVMASRFGITPTEMYQRFSVKVAGQMGQGEVLNAGTDQTQSPEFKNWFGDSKVIDAEGRPLVVYHGTPYGALEILDPDESASDSGAVFFTSDKSVAEDFASGEGITFEDGYKVKPHVVEAYLSIQNPAVYEGDVSDEVTIDELMEAVGLSAADVPSDLQDELGIDMPVWRWYSEYSSVFDVLRKAGFDGFVAKERGKTMYALFDSTQIKSATGNQGTFDPNDPNILRQSAQFPIERKKDGSIVVRGDAEAIRALLPENIKGRKVDGGMVFTPSAAPRVKAALEGHQVAYSRGGHVVKKLPMKNGKYVGAPEKFNTPSKIPTLRKWLRQLTLEGAPGRYWYENSSAEILRMTGGDIQEARRFVALLSIYSPQAKVDANGTFALRAWAQYKAGQPISVKTGVQDEKARQALADVDAFWSGEKTGNFFNNLLRMIDPSVADKQGATIDMWMMRAAQYDTDAPTATQYAFMENETNRIAQELGWEPQQVQAAIWVAMKARMENKGVKERTEASSEKKGWIRFDRSETTGKEARVIIDAKNHRNNWLKHAFEHDPTREDTAQAKFDFGDAMIRHIGQLSFEARPGRTTGVLPGIHTASYEQQLEFQQAVQAAFLDEEGNDTLAQMLGLLVDNRTNILPGVWQGEVSPSQQQRIVMAPAKGDGGKTNVDPAQAEALNLYAAMSGLVARQEGVGWHRPFYKATKRDANGLDIRLGRALTPEETVALERAVDEWMTAQGKANWNDGLAFISTPTGVRLISFGAVDNVTLQGDIVKVAESALPDFEWAHFASDGNMPTNNWQENPDGQSYIHRASAAGRSDVLLWTRDVLAPRVQQVFDDFSQRYGWGDPGRLNIAVDEEQARRDAEEQVSRRAAATPPATEYTQQSRGTFNPQTLLISLGPQSDLSTFLHESGHFFLEVMADLAAQPDAPAQVREDMGKVLGWFGVPDLATWNTYTLDQKRPHHERWAESFEQYLLEGKAPSAELQPLFRRFRAWLVNVYKSLTDFMRGRNLELNDEIRQVFDRLLATDEQIAQAEEQSGLLPDFDATNAAIERLQERSLRNLKWTLNARSKFLKQFTKEAKDLRKGILTEVLAEFEQRPDAMASRAIRKVRNKEGAERDAKIAAIADATGYATVEEMTAAVTALGPVNDAVEAEVDRRMLERHGDMATQEALEAAANEAVHNEARARSLAAELKSQDEAMNPRETTGRTDARGRPITVNALVEAARAFGADLAARRAVGKLKNAIYLHRAAEARAGKAWQTATKKGDSKAAVQAKKDQLLNNQAVRALLDAQAEVRSAIEFFRKVTKGNNEKLVKGGRDPDVVNAMRAILGAYGIAPRTGKTALEYMELVQKNDPAMYGVIAPSVNTALANAKPFSTLTVEEVRGLTDELKSLWHLAKRSRQMEIDGDLLDLEDLADQLYARMEDIGIPDVLPGETGALTDAELRKRNWLQQAPAILRRVEQWAEAKDGAFGGPFLRFIFQPVKIAADRYRADRLVYRQKFQALVDAIAPTMDKKVIAAPELGYTFGRGHNGIGMAELLHAILHTGNDSNKRKLLLGRNWATENPDGTLDTSRWDAFIARLITEGTLTKAHYDFAQGVWDLMEETKPLAQKTHRDVFGRYFAEVTANEVQTPFGTYRGGYVPAQADPLLVQDADQRELLETENAGMSYAFPATNKGFTKGRVEYNRPLKLDLRTLPQHIDKVLLFSHMEPAVRSVDRLLRRKNVAQALNKIDPAAINGMLKPWLNRSARQTVETPVSADAGLNRLLSQARARTGMALMMGNVSNTLQQITGFSTALLKVKGSHMRRAVAQYIADPKQLKNTVWSLSPYMADRASNEVAVLSDTLEAIVLNPSVYESAERFTRRHAYFLQTAMDNQMSPIIWTAAYNQALAEGMEDRMARRYADGVIRQTQGSTLPEDVSRIETGTAFARAFTQFVGYFNMLANTNATALKQIAQEQGLRKGAGKAFGVLMVGMMIPIWVAEVIAQAFRGGPPDDEDDGYLDDWLAAVFGFGTIRGILSGVPGIAQIGQSMVNRFNDNPADDKFSLSPTVSVLESAAAAPQSVYKAIADEGSAQKAVRDMSALITVTTGLPAMTLARPLGYAAGVAQGKIEPTGPVDAARGVITGTASPESKTP